MSSAPVPAVTATATPPAPKPGPATWRAARESAVACDLAPLAVLAIEGPDATTFLQGQLSNDVGALAVGAWQYTSYNSPKGRMLAGFVLWREGEGYRALLGADIAPAIRKRLAMFVLRARVTIVEDPRARLGVAGPQAATLLARSLGPLSSGRSVVQHDGHTLLVLPGTRHVLLGSAGDLARWRETSGATEAPFAVWSWLTVRAGVPMITAATQDRFVPQTANWDALGGISFQKGCYTGQEIVARTQYLGRLKERLVLAHVAADDVAAGTSLYSPAFEAQACGTVVNAAAAPDGGSDLLAVVQTTAVDAGLHLGAPDGPALAPRPLPYDVPEPSTPRPRMGR